MEQRGVIWERPGFLWGGDRRQAASLRNPPVPGDPTPVADSVTGYPRNLPCLMGGDCPATCLPSPLGAAWNDMEMWCGLKPGPLLWQFWEMDHLNVSSLWGKKEEQWLPVVRESLGGAQRSFRSQLPVPAISSCLPPCLAAAWAFACLKWDSKWEQGTGEEGEEA